jgi:hypothetical protein
MMIRVFDRRLPIKRSMMPRRLSRLSAAPSNNFQLFGSGHGSQHRRNGHELAPPLRRIGQDALDGHATHGMSDQAELIPTERIGQFPHVIGDLTHLILAAQLA